MSTGELGETGTSSQTLQRGAYLVGGILLAVAVMVASTGLLITNGACSSSLNCSAGAGTGQLLLGGGVAAGVVGVVTLVGARGLD
jgi:hypothetical protein